MRRLFHLATVLSLSACADGQTPADEWPTGAPAIGDPLPVDARITAMPGLPGVRARGGVYTFSERPFSVLADQGVVVAVVAFDFATPDGVRPGDLVDPVRGLPGAEPDGNLGGVERLRLASGWVATYRPGDSTVHRVVWEGVPPASRAWPGQAVPALGAGPPQQAWRLDSWPSASQHLPFRVPYDAAFRLQGPRSVVVGARDGRIVAVMTNDSQARTPEGARLGLSEDDVMRLSTGPALPIEDGGLRVPLDSGWIAVLNPSRLMVNRLVWERLGRVPGLDGVEVGDLVPADALELTAPYTPGVRVWPQSTMGMVRDGVGYVLGLRGGNVQIVQVATPGFATPDGIGPGSPLADAVAASVGEPERAGPRLRRLRLPSGWDALVQDGADTVYRMSLEVPRD